MPLRALERDEAGNIVQPPRLEHPHPLPCTVVLMYDGLKKLRAEGMRRSSETQSPLSEPSLAVAEDSSSASNSSSWLTRLRRRVSAVDLEAEGGEQGERGVEESLDTLETAMVKHWSLRRRVLWSISRMVRSAAERLRVILPGASAGTAADAPVVLWRGMRNMQATESFMNRFLLRVRGI